MGNTSALIYKLGFLVVRDGKRQLDIWFSFHLSVFLSLLQSVHYHSGVSFWWPICIDWPSMAQLFHGILWASSRSPWPAFWRNVCVYSWSPLLPNLWRRALSRTENCCLPGTLFRALLSWTHCFLDPSAPFFYFLLVFARVPPCTSFPGQTQELKWIYCTVNEPLPRAWEGRAFALESHDCVFL